MRNLNRRLWKHRGVTTDTRGCELSYTCYSTDRGGFKVVNGRVRGIVDRLYVDDVFGLRSKTLADLKKKIGER